MARRAISLNFQYRSLLLTGLVCLGAGCSSFLSRSSVACKGEGWPVLPSQESGKDGPGEPKGPPPSALPILGSKGHCYRYQVREKTPRTLLEWQMFREEDKREHEEEKDKREEENKGAKDQNEEEKGKDEEKKDADKKNGIGKDRWEIEWEEPLESDRPDFGAATTNVGRGRLLLETGYSYLHDHGGKERVTGHSYPEALLHIGAFADWFEFRIGQNYANFRTTPVGGELGGVGAVKPTSQHGFQDLYLGVRLALTEQQKYLPQSVVILQSTVPTGASVLTAGRMLPGAIYLFNWEFGERPSPFGVAKPWTLGGLFEADRAVGDTGHAYVQLAQTLEVKYQWTPRFSTFVEWVALYPTGAGDPGVGPQYYIHPGVMFLVSNNIQLDAHVFIGLNRHSIDFYGGPGLCIRY